MTRLVAGERIRLDPDDLTVWEVLHVGTCSAIVVEQYARPKQVTLTDRHGVERTFEVTTGRTLQISPFSFVEREA